MLDIDFFKKVNDQHGHEAGDRVLGEVSERLASSIRKTDCLVRYGGEEFCCILPETTLGNASLLGERFRCSVEQMAVVTGGTELRVTISLGVAQLTADDIPASLLKRADEGLYQAKQAATGWHPPPVPPPLLGEEVMRYSLREAAVQYPHDGVDHLRRRDFGQAA